ncbi:MAG: flavodoxin family protein [Bacteroidota bacterium]
MRTKAAALLFFICLSGAALSQQTTDRPIVLIVYYSEGGHTRQLAEAVASGAETVREVEVRLRSVEDVDSSEVLSAAAIILGSPVFNAAVAPKVQTFVNSWPFNGLMKDKIGAAFTTGGGISAGEELVQVSLLHSMMMFGMIIVGGEHWRSAFGASAVTNEEPFQKGRVSKQFLEKGVMLGKRVAKLALRLKLSP